MPDLHLSHEELTAWRDQGTGDRAHIVAHLAACAACRTVAAEVERSRPAEGPPVRFAVRDFVSRGYRARGPSAVPRSAGAWVWLTAAAVVVALALVPVWLARVDGPPVTRGDAAPIALVRPVDVSVVASELTFEWTGTSTGDRVRLNVVDLEKPGDPLIEREVEGSRYVPTLEERQRFRPGQSVHWYVEALGGHAGTSPAARFRVR